jgi:hypothetical protein
MRTGPVEAMWVQRNGHMGCVMAEEQKDRGISALYLELASECFNKAATAKDVGAAEALQRMGRNYFTQAVALDPSLSSISDFPRSP